jgi:hypothetical protein
VRSERAPNAPPDHRRASKCASPESGAPPSEPSGTSPIRAELAKRASTDLGEVATAKPWRVGASPTQSESEWIELGAYEDLVAWIDVREVTLGAGTNVQINLQTAPIKDEYLFVTMESSPLTVTAALTAPSVRKILLSQATGGSGAPIPLGRFLRWQLVANGSPSASWDLSRRPADPFLRTRGNGRTGAEWKPARRPGPPERHDISGAASSPGGGVVARVRARSHTRTECSKVRCAGGRGSSARRRRAAAMMLP